MNHPAAFKAVRERLSGGLIASCQPVDHGPMDRTDIVTAMALAAVAGGAAGLRIEGVERVRSVTTNTAVPVVGIVKRDMVGTPVRITPILADVAGLAAAGATIIAFDATRRPRPVPASELLAAIHDAGCLAMADCSNLDDAHAMAELGCEFTASTLSGYTEETTPDEPDLAFVRSMAEAGYCVIAEGRFNSPRLAAAAIEAGAHAVTVGSAITRIEHITSWFGAELAAASRRIGA